MKDNSFSKFMPLLLLALMGASGSAVIAFNAYLLGRYLSASVLTAACLGVFGFYVLDSSSLYNPEDQINKPSRWLLFQEFEHKLFLLGSLSVSISFLLIIREIHTWTQTFLLAGLGLFAAFYSSRVFNFARKVPYLKTFWVTVTWAIAAVFIPLLFGQQTSAARVDVRTISVFNFMWLFIDTSALDLLDRKGDAAFGIVTVSRILSPKVSFRILVGASTFISFASLLFLKIPNEVKLISIVQAIGLMFFAFKKTELNSPWFELVVMSWRLVMILVFFTSANKHVYVARRKTRCQSIVQSQMLLEPLASLEK